MMCSTILDHLQSSGRFPCSGGQQQHMLHILFIIGVHGAYELLTEDRKLLKVGDGCFFLLPGWHAFHWQKT